MLVLLAFDEVDVVVGFVAELPLLLEPMLVLGFPPLPLFIVWLETVVVVA